LRGEQVSFLRFEIGLSTINCHSGSPSDSEAITITGNTIGFGYLRPSTIAIINQPACRRPRGRNSMSTPAYAILHVGGFIHHPQLITLCDTHQCQITPFHGPTRNLSGRGSVNTQNLNPTGGWTSAQGLAAWC